MSMLGASREAVRSQEGFNKHRFDNYTAWLDREDRNRAKASGKPLGFGFAEPRPSPEPREAQPFFVQEAAFTSGLLVTRKYDKLECGYATEATRTDPWHFPNDMEVEDKDHYKDRRRRNQHCDPARWVVDPQLRDAVSEQEVESQCRAHRGETRAQHDPKLMGLLFDNNVRLQPEALKELNVDLSCAELPEREGGGSAHQQARAAAIRSKSTGAQSHTHASAAKKDHPWSWCLAGRKPQMEGQGPLSPKMMDTLRSQSLPQLMEGGPSMQPGNEGGSNSPFHGLSTRRFGLPFCDPRMRGGRLARDGWAGTFPAKQIRPM